MTFSNEDNMSDRSTEVTYKFHLPEQKDDVWMVQNADKMYGLLWDIQEKARSRVKYSENQGEVDFAMQIHDLIVEEIDLYEVE